MNRKLLVWTRSELQRPPSSCPPGFLYCFKLTSKLGSGNCLGPLLHKDPPCSLSPDVTTTHKPLPHTCTGTHVHMPWHTTVLAPPSQHAPDCCFLLPCWWWPNLLPSPTLCSQIYCHGELLRQVQMAKLYQHDKQFVDMPLSSAPGESPRGPLLLLNLPPKGRGQNQAGRGVWSGKTPWGPADPSCCLSPDQVLRRFCELAQAHNLSIPRQELQVFGQEHFRAVGQELQPWTPEDWRDRYNPGHRTGEGPSLSEEWSLVLLPIFWLGYFLLLLLSQSHQLYVYFGN